MSSKSTQLFLARNFSSSVVANGPNKSFKLLVVGGGAGGCSTAAKFTKKLGGSGQVGVIEPSDMHYYQPMWTLVGGGLKDISQSGRPMASVLPKNAEWLKTKAAAFDPDRNLVRTEDGQEVTYEYLVVAVGLQTHFDQIKGLPEALEAVPEVCSNYHPKYATKTAEAIRNFKSGNAVFTFPKMPIKCPGAPQKIVYIAERQFVKAGKRDKANIMYFSTLPVLFGVKKYADALWKVVEGRGIEVNLQKHLIEVDADKREAVFEDLADPTLPPQRVPFDLLHASPPMSAPDALKNHAPNLVDAAGFVDVHPKTMQHKKYPNVFAIGDCSNIPTAKTAAAVADQLTTLKKNLWTVMKTETDVTNSVLRAEYSGYTSCPLVTGPGECILAEFDGSAAPPQPMETFPFNQAKPRWLMYQAKANIMPTIYWQMLQGRWEGPKYFRKAFHLGMSK